MHMKMFCCTGNQGLKLPCQHVFCYDSSNIVIKKTCDNDLLWSRGMLQCNTELPLSKMTSVNRNSKLYWELIIIFYPPSFFCCIIIL